MADKPKSLRVLTMAVVYRCRECLFDIYVARGFVLAVWMVVSQTAAEFPRPAVEAGFALVYSHSWYVKAEAVIRNVVLGKNCKMCLLLRVFADMLLRPNKRHNYRITFS